MCMCVCVQEHMCLVSTYEGQRLTPITPQFFSWGSLSLKLVLSDWLHSLASELPESTCLCSSSLWCCWRCEPPYPALQLLLLPKQRIYQLSHPQDIHSCHISLHFLHPTYIQCITITFSPPQCPLLGTFLSFWTPFFLPSRLPLAYTIRQNYMPSSSIH